MTDEFRIRELLEEVLDSGRTPEEVCAECPELLSVVKKRLRQIRRVEHGLESLFPSSATQSAGATPTAGQNKDELAQIYGKSIRDRPVGRLQRGAKWARSRPVAVALIVLVVVLLVAIVGASIWVRQQQKARQNNKLHRRVGTRQAIEPMPDACWRRSRAFPKRKEYRLGGGKDVGDCALGPRHGAGLVGPAAP
jgi:hypothetical protein